MSGERHWTDEPIPYGTTHIGRSMIEAAQKWIAQNQEEQEEHEHEPEPSQLSQLRSIPYQIIIDDLIKRRQEIKLSMEYSQIGKEVLKLIDENKDSDEGGVYCKICRYKGCNAFEFGDYIGSEPFVFKCDTMHYGQSTPCYNYAWCDKHIETHLGECSDCKDKWNNEEKCF